MVTMPPYSGRHLTAAQSLIDLRGVSWTLRLARPRRRRRFSTLRPPGLRMRMRKPWVLSRLRTFGCQVRFGISYSL